MSMVNFDVLFLFPSHLEKLFVLLLLLIHTLHIPFQRYKTLVSPGPNEQNGQKKKKAKKVQSKESVFGRE
jgi:hypothetical protein